MKPLQEAPYFSSAFIRIMHASVAGNNNAQETRRIFSAGIFLQCVMRHNVPHIPIDNMPILLSIFAAIIEFLMCIVNICDLVCVHSTQFISAAKFQQHYVEDELLRPPVHSGAGASGIFDRSVKAHFPYNVRRCVCFRSTVVNSTKFNLALVFRIDNC